jgi:type IV secretory pathway VirB2 component (pilin)
MHQLLRLTGLIAGVLGVLVCAISGLARLFGVYYLGGYESTAIFMAGTGIMVFACLVKLELMSRPHN